MVDAAEAALEQLLQVLHELHDDAVTHATAVAAAELEAMRREENRSVLNLRETGVFVAPCLRY